MINVDYHGVSIDWTDDEWNRLEQIKNEKYMQRENKCFDASMAFTLKSELKEKVKAYAEGHGITPSELMRQALYIICR